MYKLMHKKHERRETHRGAVRCDNQAHRVFQNELAGICSPKTFGFYFFGIRKHLASHMWSAGPIIFCVDSRFISISFSLSSLLPLGVLLAPIFLTSLLSIFVHSSRTHCMCVLPLSLLLLLFLPVFFSFSLVPYIFLPF